MRLPLVLAALACAACAGLPLTEEIAGDIGTRQRSLRETGATLFGRETSRLGGVADLPPILGRELARPATATARAGEALGHEMGRLRSLPSPADLAGVFAESRQNIETTSRTLVTEDVRRMSRGFESLQQMWAREQELPLLNRTSPLRLRL